MSVPDSFQSSQLGPGLRVNAAHPHDQHGGDRSEVKRVLAVTRATASERGLVRVERAGYSGLYSPATPVPSIRPLTARSTRWILSGLFVLAALASLPGRALAETFYADLDRDGQRDIITIQVVPVPALRVWLSGSNSSLLLPTRRPIAHVAASDIDGDGHIDLIASDTSSRVHVWHRTHRGGLRPTRPRHVPRTSGVSRSQTLGNPSGDLPGAVLDEGTSTPVDASHPAGPALLDALRLTIAASSLATASFNSCPPQPRGPPLG